MSRPVIAVFGSSQTRPSEPGYEQAARLGRLLVDAGFDVTNGGYGGTMEAVSFGAADAGGRVIGVTAPVLFPNRPGANQHVTEERPAETLTERIHEMMAISAGAVTLPGSIGTLTELMVTWNDVFIASMSDRPRRPVVAVGAPWDSLVPHIGDALDTDTSLIRLVDSVDEAVAHLGATLT